MVLSLIRRSAAFNSQARTESKSQTSTSLPPLLAEVAVATPRLPKRPLCSRLEPALSFSARFADGLRCCLQTRSRPNYVDREQSGAEHGFARKDHLAQRAVLGFDSLELIEHQIAEGIEDHAVADTLPGLYDVGVMAHHHSRAGFDCGVGEVELLVVRLRGILDACVHGYDHHIGVRL